MDKRNIVLFAAAILGLFIMVALCIALINSWNRNKAINQPNAPAPKQESPTPSAPSGNEQTPGPGTPSSPQKQPENQPENQGAIPETVTVNIQNSNFVPQSITVNSGTTVTWTNQDNITHNVKFDSVSSPNLSQGQSFEFKFETPGTYEYHCSIHPDMTGVVIVNK